MNGYFGADSTADEVLAGVDLIGKRVLVTGVSSGLGAETARALVKRGASVVGTARDLGKARSIARQFSAGGGGGLELVELDLGALASVRACADALISTGKPLHAIIANAGIMACPKQQTVDGFEAQFGTNHLGHFLLVNKLTPLLASGARLVSLSSSAHRSVVADAEDPNFDHTPYNEWQAYGRSKAANALFAVEFDRRHRARGIRAAAVHPGGIPTDLDRHLPAGSMQEMSAAMDRDLIAAGKPPLRWKTVAQGVATTLWAACVADADTVGGKYCEDCSVAEINEDPSSLEGVCSYIYDPQLGKGLWMKSEELVGETFA